MVCCKLLDHLITETKSAQPPGSDLEDSWVTTHGQHVVLWWGGLPFCSSAVGVFYSPNRQGDSVMIIGVRNEHGDPGSNLCRGYLHLDNANTLKKGIFLPAMSK